MSLSKTKYNGGPSEIDRFERGLGSVEKDKSVETESV